MPKPSVRKGTPSVQLAKEEFSKRARERFYDPSFAAVTPELKKIIDVAWKNYTEYHKSPRTRPAGPGFSDPVFASERMARDSSRHRPSGKTSEARQVEITHSAHQRLHSQRPNLSRRNVENLSSHKSR